MTMAIHKSWHDDMVVKLLHFAGNEFFCCLGLGEYTDNSPSVYGNSTVFKNAVLGNDWNNPLAINQQVYFFWTHEDSFKVQLSIPIFLSLLCSAG